MTAATAHPKTRDDDARGTPPGSGTIVPAHGGQIGNPAFVATDAMRADVEAWVRAGATGEDIAVLIEANHDVACSRATVDRHFKKELATGRAKLKVAIGGSLVKDALSGNMTAKIFWLRTQAKWNTRVEHEAIGGGAIRTFDFSGLALDEKRVLLGVIDQLLAQIQDDKSGQPEHIIIDATART